MNITIRRESNVPIYQQIRKEIENLILKRELVSGFKLPSERSLAKELNIHRNTVIKAYSELIAEGIVVSSRNKPRGYFVKSTHLDETFTQRFFPLEKNIKYNLISREKEFLEIFQNSGKNNQISMAGLVMDYRMMPTESMTEIIQSVFGDSTVIKTLRPLGIEQTMRMKRNIRDILKNENMYINTNNIQIVSETNQALSHIASLYLEEGDTIIAEEPMVADNVSIFRNKKINVVTIPMEDDGMNLKRLNLEILKHKPKFIYTMPNFHNPTGISMSLEKRIELLQITDLWGIPIIEEDSQRDFRYFGNKIPSLYSLDKNNSVIYVDSFTLTFPYGIKTGYIVGPKDLIEMLGELIIIDETYVSNFGQFLLNEYIERGFYKKHIIRIVEHYAKICKYLCQRLDELNKLGVSYFKPYGGLLIWLTLDYGLDERKIYEYLLKRKILVMPGQVFFPYKHDKGHIRLCFSNVDKEEVGKAMDCLEDALKSC